MKVWNIQQNWSHKKTYVVAAGAFMMVVKATSLILSPQWSKAHCANLTCSGKYLASPSVVDEVLNWVRAAGSQLSGRSGIFCIGIPGRIQDHDSAPRLPRKGSQREGILENRRYLRPRPGTPPISAPNKPQAAPQVADHRRMRFSSPSPTIRSRSTRERKLSDRLIL